MSALLAALVAALPRVLISMLSMFVTEKFLQSVLQRIVVYALQRAVAMTSNTVDDEVVADIEKRFKEAAPKE